MVTHFRKSKETGCYEVISREPLSEADRARMLYESRQKMEWDNRAREQGAREEGRSEGETSRALAIAKNLLKMGMPIDKVVMTTGLTREEVEGLHNAN